MVCKKCQKNKHEECVDNRPEGMEPTNYCTCQHKPRQDNR